jgi:hypothetical protein
VSQHQTCGLTRIFVAAAILTVVLLMGHDASAQPIWFVPKSGNAPVADFMSLFQPDAPWNMAASRIAVFGMALPPRTAQADADLATVFTDLRRRDIALSIDMLPLTGASSIPGTHCGYHVEGYSAPGGPLSIAQWVKSLGGEPQYFEMDEPLYFGHVYDGANACHSSIDEIVQDIAEKVRQVQSVFPNVRIGDGEPMGFKSDTWLADVEKFISAYRAATGQNLAFFRLDIGWGEPWRETVRPLAQLLRANQIPLQVIYNGDGGDRSGEKWIEQAMKRAEEFEKVITPDAVSIQCWTDYPNRLLPEADPGTLTNLVNRYVAWKAGRR